MSLRRRLFLLLGGLICLLLVGQWLLFRSLTRAVTDDVRTVAFRVGEEILSGFSYRTESHPRSKTPDDSPDGSEPPTETHVVVVTSGAEAEAGAAAWTALAEPVPGDDPQRVMVRREIHFESPGPAEAGTAVVAGAEVGTSGPHLRQIVLETDAARDVLFVRGPAMKRRIPIPNAEVASTLDRFGTQLLLGNLALLAGGLLAAAVMAHRLTRPLADLTEAAERLGSGELGAAVDLRGAARADEVGRAITAFNRMSTRLAELDRENRRLASAEHLSELGEVARGLAHSLRNPLNALGLAIEQVGAPAEVVEGSRRQIRRMDGALRSFLALASAGSAQAEPVDVAQLAREVALEALQDGAGRVGIDVETVTSSGGPGALCVSAVPAELKAVLQALVVNAVEASPAGGRVTLRLAPGETGGVRIQVDDQGAGVPDEVRGRLFEPHVTTKPHGSGMGLFLAHRLVTGRYAGDLRLAPRGADHRRHDGHRSTSATAGDERRTTARRRGRGGPAPAPRRAPRHRGLQRRRAGSVAEAVRELGRAPIDLVISDWRLPDGDGGALLARVRAQYPDLGFVMVTAYGTIARAVEAIRAGADDYLAKPFEAQALQLAIDRTLARRRLERENRRLAAEIGERNQLVDLLGRSAAMHTLFARVERLAGTQATILLTGESGTGKELAARALHQLSARSSQPFVAVNCAAIPEGLLESEFFGVERGAFTGADRTRAGSFEAADAGTLFLDEIGELPLALQPKLLRALQEGKVSRVGASAEIAVDVRVVAATNRDLLAEIAAGRFRQDLYYRLNVVPLALPPLRERREDIALLAEHFAARAARRHGLAQARFPAAVRKALIEYAWPGNVRELANVVERLTLLADAGEVQLEDLPPELSGRPQGEGGFRLPAQGLSWEAHEREALRQALDLSGGNRARAARLLDLPYKAFLYRLEKHGLAEPETLGS